MSDLRTIFTDDDGDGIFDDTHVVNVMRGDVPTSQVQYTPVHHEHEYKVRNSPDLLSGKTKLKIGAIIAIVVTAIGIIAPIPIIGIMMLLKLLGLF